jgi:hypothetical protein
MRRWLLVFLCSIGGIVVGAWLGFRHDYDTASLTHIFIGAPVIKIADFFGRLLYHDPEAALLFLLPVAAIYCGLIGAAVGFGLSFFLVQRPPHA